MPLGALDDPLAEQLIGPGVFGEALLAAVFDLAGGLEQEEAGVGVGAVDAPAFEVVRQGDVILFGVVAEERQTKTALALERAVTGAGVAAHAAEQAHDVPLEIDFLHDAAAGQSHFGAGGAGGESQEPWR